MHSVRVVAPFPYNSEGAGEFAETFGEVFTELQARTGITVGGASIPTAVREVDQAEALRHLASGSRSRSSGPFLYRYLELSTDTRPVADSTLVVLGRAWQGHEVPGVAARLAAQSLEELVARVVFASQIANPGHLALDAPLILHDEVLQAAGTPISWILHEAIDLAARFHWPMIRVLPVAEALHWLERLPGFTSGRSDSPVGRAVAALSYIVAKRASDHSPVDLAWAMYGLEALFARSTQGLAQQLATNTELLLGPRSQHKKSVSRLYDFRSRFLHGAINIPLAFATDEVLNETDDFGPDAYSNWGLAVTVLVASLQELVDRDWHTLDFRTVVEGATASR